MVGNDIFFWGEGKLNYFVNVGISHWKGDSRSKQEGTAGISKITPNQFNNLDISLSMKVNT